MCLVIAISEGDKKYGFRSLSPPPYKRGQGDLNYEFPCWRTHFACVLTTPDKIVISLQQRTKSLKNHN
jgi:hypothetical protein